MIKLDTSQKLWRQFLFWGLAVNSTVLPALILAIFVFTTLDITQLVIMLGTILGGALAAAGIRQWGKNAGVEK